MSVSVIIPCFNDGEFIEQAINSIINQSLPGLEIIVVDDGSDSDTKKILSNLKGKIDTLITQENSGQSIARNVGITASKGEYILVLDSDDFFEDTFLEKALPIIKKNKLTKIVTCWANLIYKDKNNILYKPLGGKVNRFLTHNNALGSALFRKKDWREVGGYNELMVNGLEDWEFYIRLLKDGGEARVVPEVLYNYRKRKATTTEKANKVRYKLLKYIFDQHKEVYGKHVDALFTGMLWKLENEEKERVRLINTKEYKIGQSILKPFRFLKRIFK